ncbi:hypothetical protein BZG36_03625 [Bifiguratus adelaidae]|uniref:Xylanolytic transcriptional activator regulatory domain-containing protein n=1 Tax=Bifiguratus adelaidae TaxID=1938954 RepID=A0A261Y067_9FUNG|nr:hypothetical protein BZG36_03625 [Bifiguratus adelaidae]
MVNDGQSNQATVELLINELTGPIESPSETVIERKTSKNRGKHQLSLQFPFETDSKRKSPVSRGSSLSPQDYVPSTSESMYPEDESEQEQEGEEFESISKAMGELSIDDANSVRYFGKSSGFYMLQQKSHFPSSGRKYEAENDIEPGVVNPLELPPLDLSEALINAYFEHFHPQLPILRPEFFLPNQGRPAKQPPLLLLNTVYALGARVCNQSLFDTNCKMPGAGNGMFFRRAKMFLDDDYDMLRITTVQALILLAIHEHGCARNSRGWHYAGMAFRMAQDLGLNRNSENWDIDLDERDIDIPLPKPTDYLKNPDGEAVLLHFLQCIGLAEIVGQVLRKLYAPCKVAFNPPAISSILSSLDHALYMWRENLPPPLRLPEDLTQIEKQNLPLPISTVMLHMEYYTITILLHRPFIPKADKRDTSAPAILSPSLSICTSTANGILELALITKRRKQVRCLHHLATYSLFTACIIFINNASNDSARQSYYSKINIKRNLEVLDDMRATWPVALRMSSILGDLADLRELILHDDGKFVKLEDVKVKQEPESPGENGSSASLLNVGDGTNIDSGEQSMPPAHIDHG